jgi:hypothetical protein
MKTTIRIKKALQLIMVGTIIIASVVTTKNIVKNIKYLYGLEAAGSGTTCFFDLIQ